MTEEEETYEGNAFCRKCRVRQDFKDAYVTVSDTGHRMAHGSCVTCGGKMSRILGRESKEQSYTDWRGPLDPIPVEEQYQTVTLGDIDPITLDKQVPLGWYSIHGGEIFPQPDMRTGYERLRDWFWNRAHDLSERKGYCDGGFC